MLDVPGYEWQEKMGRGGKRDELIPVQEPDLMHSVSAGAVNSEQ